MLDTEILVHITAPSRASDDRHYRKLAQAYLDFQPANQISISINDISSASQTDNTLSSERWIESPDLSFNSVQDNRDSPRLLVPLQQGASQESNNSWVAPPSVVADSQPDNDISIADYCSPTRVLEHFLQRRGSPSTQSQGLSGTEYPSQKKSPLLDIGKQSGVLPQLRGLPATASGSPAASSPSPEPRHSSPLSPTRQLPRPRAASLLRKRPSPPVDQVPSSEARPDSGSQVVIPYSLTDSETQPPPKKRRRTRELDNLFAVQCTSDLGPGTSPLPVGDVSRSGGGKDDQLEIWGPPPPASCDDIDLSSLITRKLVKLVRDLGMARYGPKKQHREVRPWERGFWLLDTTTWDDGLVQRCWGFLGTYLRQGDAGWSVHCRRDPARHWIRVYCFGHIAPHIYLLLYTASEQEVCYTGTTWHGGDGSVLITVNPRKQRRSRMKA